MNSGELAFAPGYELRGLLDSREVSSVELTEMFLGRIEELNPILNAFLTVCGEEAVASARQADERIGRGDGGEPLLGIPVSIKDLEVTKGIRSTMGSLAYRDYVPKIDSITSERVRRSGAVILGKTNTPEFGLLGTTENRLGDACRNPWNTDRTSGGSSGGAAAALVVGSVYAGDGQRRGRVYPHTGQLLRRIWHQAYAGTGGEIWRRGKCFAQLHVAVGTIGAERPRCRHAASGFGGLRFEGHDSHAGGATGLRSSGCAEPGGATGGLER